MLLQQKVEPAAFPSKSPKGTKLLRPTQANDIGRPVLQLANPAVISAMTETFSSVVGGWQRTPCKTTLTQMPTDFSYSFWRFQFQSRQKNICASYTFFNPGVTLEFGRPSCYPSWGTVETCIASGAGRNIQSRCGVIHVRVRWASLSFFSRQRRVKRGPKQEG